MIRGIRALPVGTVSVFVALAFALAAGYLLVGPLGLVAMAVAGGLIGLLAAWARLPRPTRRRRAGRARRAAVTLDDFPAYRDIAGRLRWAWVSRRHFDLMVRPMLAGLLAAVLADRHRIDMAATPAPARALVGDRVWELLDPARPAERDTSVPGIDVTTIELIIDTLESL